MDFQLIAIDFGDVAWIAMAFALGLLSRTVGLPPLVGFLATGFLLNLYGISGGDMLRKLSDLGITLLLFTVGLKLNLRTFARPQVWAVTGLHMAIVVPLFTTAIYALAALGTSFFSGLDFSRSLLIAFALSFSSTVFVVKVLEDRGQTAALHGRIAIGILIVQDLAAVVFLAISAGKWPTYWALLVLLVFPLRPLLAFVLRRVGHGELLILYGFLLALGGAQLFELVGLKGDLGALVLGVLISSHTKADEMAKAMLGFKDLFLLAFFLSVGLSGRLTLETVLVGAAAAPFLLLKSGLFFGLLTAFRLQARTALLASLNLGNFSEFGLIVAAIGVANGWIDTDWLIVIAIALSLSCAISAGLNAGGHRLYTRYRTVWKRLQRQGRLSDDRILDIGQAKIAIIGMGSIGTGAYDTIHRLEGGTVVGVDTDPITVVRHRATGRNVLLGDPADAEFWDRVEFAHSLELVMLALPNLAANLAVLDQLRAAAFSGRVAATAWFQDEVGPLEKAGVSTVFNVYEEAGSGFAAHVAGQLPVIAQSGRLRMASVSNSSEEEASHSDVDHGLGDVDALFVVADEASPSCEPAEGALDDPAARHDLEARLIVEAADDLDDEIEERGLVHELPAVIGAVGEQMLDPGPTLAQRLQNYLRSGTVGYVGGGEIDHQKTTVGIHRHMSLAPDGLLRTVVAPLRPRSRRLDRLAVDNPGARAGLAADALAVNHQGKVVNGAEQHQTHKAPEPPIHRLPGRKVLRQHPPPTSRARHVADRVQHLAQVNLRLAAPFRRRRQQRGNLRPFLIRQIGRITLRPPLDRGHTAARLWCPHALRESQSA